MKLINQITTPIDLFNWAKDNVDIKTFYVSSDEVINNQDVIKKRMDEALPVQGTRGFYCYIPLNSFQVSESPLSGLDSEFLTFDVFLNRSLFSFESFSIKDYIACIYEEDGLWYVAKICEIDQINQEYLVSFLSPDGESGFQKGFKQTNEKEMMCVQSVLLKINSIHKTTVRSPMLKFNQEEFDNIWLKYTQRMADGS